MENVNIYSTGIPSTVFSGWYGYTLLKEYPYYLRFTVPQNGKLSQIDTLMMTTTGIGSSEIIFSIYKGDIKPIALIDSSDPIKLSPLKEPTLISYKFKNIFLHAGKNYFLGIAGSQNYEIPRVLKLQDDFKFLVPVWLISTCIDFSYNPHGNASGNEAAPCVEILMSE